MQKLYTHSFIEALKTRRAIDIVVEDAGKSITAGKLFNDAHQLALQLALKGVQDNHKVVLAVQPGITFLKIIYAQMMLGSVMAIIDPEMGSDNYRNKWRQFNPQHAFVDSKLAFIQEHPILKWILQKSVSYIPSFPLIGKYTLFKTGWRLPTVRKSIHLSKLFNPKVSNPPFAPSTGAKDKEFLLTYTSGTLNEPKGVVHTIESISHTMDVLGQMILTHKDKSIATHLPHYALLAVNTGIKVCFWDNSWTAEKKLEFIKKHQITTLIGPPSDFLPLVRKCTSLGEQLPDCLKTIYLGSAPVYPSFLGQLVTVADNVKLVCLYGMTENLMVCSIDGKEKLKQSAGAKGDCVGKPFKEVDIKLAADGEILLKSPQLFARYFHLSERPEFHPTGDLGSIDKDGNLFLIGRKKDMIIRGNFNLYPGLYEPTINKIKGVNQAVLIGVYDHNKADEKVILVVESDKNVSQNEIMAQLQSGSCSIDKEALPDKIVFMKLPLSGRQNKIDRNQLRNALS